MEKNITLREAAAIAALQGILAKEYEYNIYRHDKHKIEESFNMVREAVIYADALINELNKTIPTK